jgi:hypothetical protein
MDFLDSIFHWLFGQRKPTVVDVYQPTYGGTGVGTTNLPPPIKSVAKPRVVHRAQRDFNPQFQNRADYLLAMKLNPDRRFLIPHFMAQEGNAIKYIDIRGGSQTKVLNSSKTGFV